MEAATEIKKKPRYKCPFYGFNIGGIQERVAMTDSDGNQCSFCGGYSPCEMEVQGRIPDWAECRVSSRADIEEFIKKDLATAQVFPNEFYHGQSPWTGISFEEWRKYVMDPATPRPE